MSEITLVPGFDAVAQQVSDWQDFLTVSSQGKVDLNAAPAKVLAAVAVAIRNPGSPAAEYNRLLEPNEGANAIVRKRSGADGIEGTSDDKPLSESDWDFVSVVLDIPMPDRSSGDPWAQMVDMSFGFNQ